MIDTVHKMLKKLYLNFLRLWSSRTREKYARLVGVQLGKNCRINSANFGTEPYLIYIGDHVTVSYGVQFITHDGGLWVLREEFPGVDYIRPIVVHRNSFIGINAILMPGVVVGPNSIVGAGAVVTKNVPPNSIAVGIPAHVISNLETYKWRVDDRFLTHGMSPEAKREYLLKTFGVSVEEWRATVDALDTRHSGL